MIPFKKNHNIANSLDFFKVKTKTGLYHIMQSLKAAVLTLKENPFHTYDILSMV